MFNLIIFGAPGSGKGTQSIKIAQKHNLMHVSTGDILRTEVKNQTELGLQAQRMIESGNLVPDELIIEILQSLVEKNKNVKGFIFDGFPRTLVQAKKLDALMHLLNKEIAAVISLDVSDEEVIIRLLKRAEIERRKDDNRETINQRLSVYKEQTTPLLDYYQQQNKLVSIAGTGSIEEIFENICTRMEQKGLHPQICW